MLRTLLQNTTRALHTTRVACAGVEKNALSALRKKTGYTFANCKKALELHQNNVEQAEKWLHEQAQNLGWSKATKLAERATAQGLVGVLVRGNIGAMVEVNCETDFVARNENFRSFVEHATRICALYTENTLFDGDLWKLGFEVEALRHLKTINNKTLSDDLALLIGTVGENATIKRAICFKTNNDLRLSGYAHPAQPGSNIVENVIQLGKYGTLVAFRGDSDNEELQRQLCQHILGMNPRKIGEYGVDEAAANKDDETCLIHQEYIYDADQTVGQVMQQNNLQVIDYHRYECGQATERSDDELVQAKLKN